MRPPLAAGGDLRIVKLAPVHNRLARYRRFPIRQA
jgi:hypothetical protein